jgi:hypothetical protein
VADNPWLNPLDLRPFAALADGTPLYPAYLPLQSGEGYRRNLNSWSGESGEWIGVTEDGRLFQQTRFWGHAGAAASRWEPITIPFW